jgi:hypothetical protein
LTVDKIFGASEIDEGKIECLFHIMKYKEKVPDFNQELPHISCGIICFSCELQ